jgi:hypothetical protein
MLILLAACESPVSVDYDHRKPFSQWKSYAWLEKPATEKQDPLLYSSLLDQRMHRSVDRALSVRQYRLVQDAGKADFLVTYHVVVKQKLEVEPQFSYGFGVYNSPWAVGMQDNVRQYDEGQLLIDILDPVSRDLVWRGSIKKPLSDNRTPVERDAAVDKAVNRILAAFPPLK